MSRLEQQERDSTGQTSTGGWDGSFPNNGLGARGRWRFVCFGGLALLWFLIVILRLWNLQVLEGGRLSDKAVRQQEARVDIPARRGGLLDRHGAELALSTPVQSIGVFADRVEDPGALAATLGEILDVDEAALLARLRRGGFQWAKRFVSLAEEERARELDLDLLHFETETRRYYPHGSVASHVLGTVGIDHEGQAGLELRFDRQLKGEAGVGVLHYDARQRRYGRQILEPTVPGSDLLLHLDLQLQSLVHMELERAMEETKSQAGTVVLMKPDTGEIVAMASAPSFDPNQLSRTREDLEKQRNFAVSYMVEPGSTFKVLTAAAALEEGLVSVDDVFDCEMGGMWIHRRRIRDHHPYGLLTMPQVLMKSSNVGIIKIGYRLGERKFANYLHRFGFGRPTGVALPGEAHGLVRPLSRWSGSSLASLAMGQEVGVTAVQMARLFSAIANGGTLVQPRIVRAVRHYGKPAVELEREPDRRVISPATAATMQAILERVVENGTGRLAQIPGYRVGGKTGTAQMVNPETGSYVNGAYMASFCGFAPVNKPALVGVAMLYDPRGQHYYGGRIAAPLFGSVMRRALRRLDIPPADAFPRSPVPENRIPEGVLTDFIADPLGEGAERAGLIQEPAPVAPPSRSRESAPSAPRRPAEPVRDWASFDTRDRAAAARELARKAPDMRGLTMREAFSVAAELGIDIEPNGSGLARAQSPEPHAALQPGQVLQLYFGLSSLQPVEAGYVSAGGGG